MLGCKEVSLLVSQSLDRKLLFRQRVAVRMYLMTRKFCSRYKEQLLHPERGGNPVFRGGPRTHGAIFLRIDAAEGTLQGKILPFSPQITQFTPFTDD